RGGHGRGAGDASRRRVDPDPGRDGDLRVGGRQRAMMLFRGLLTALGFLTRIPVPAGSWAPGPSVAFFPAVGLLLGTISAGAAWLLFDRFGLAPHPVWALALVGLQALLTGALHLDGLSDVVDGLGGGRGDRARALEIMKDPR